VGAAPGDAVPGALDRRLVSYVGTWMQTVGAQWLLVSEPHAAALVSLVQTAQALPVLLLALPAGVLADSFDRRRLLLRALRLSEEPVVAQHLLTAAAP
jgi:MFS family permease